ncbi:MAG TPA: DUF2267 domain-containing protein [Solirubrobacteraceae bacterium]|jgi:uncharacterized protein (DUF2267 family)|nr:DUF2267 domain-containing protein [Solirubrobacteraceae bacterium]
MTRAQAGTDERSFLYTEEWRYERFTTTIEQRAGISWTQAERAARAVLETLGERISADAARELEQELPFQLSISLHSLTHGRAQSFDAKEFVRRAAAREGVDPETAQAHARAVFIALARLVRGEETAKLEQQLSQDYQWLFGVAIRRRRDRGAHEIVGVELFAKRVARRTGLDADAARGATEAVLETLAERIGGGEVDDVEEQLPDELVAPLERGKASSRGRAQAMSLDEFVARSAEREGTDYAQALDHARAVFAGLRETLGDSELSGCLSELPRGYHEALL